MKVAKQEGVKGGFLHFSESAELPRPVVAADPTDGQRWVEEFHKPLGVQLQVAQQRFHT